MAEVFLSTATALAAAQKFTYDRPLIDTANKSYNIILWTDEVRLRFDLENLVNLDPKKMILEFFMDHTF